MLHLPFLPKKRCTCFLQYGTHEFVGLLHEDGSIGYRCIHCQHPAEEAIQAEQEWEVATHAGNESAFIKGRQGIPDRWGRWMPWRS